MVYKYLKDISFLFLLVLGTSVFAQDEDLQSTVDSKVNQMKAELNLTDRQAYAIDPIIKDYMVKRQAVLQEVSDQGIIDHAAVKSTLKGLKENEYRKLGKILTEDQMKKWVDKENLRATLNPDSGESPVDDSPSLTANGANFKF